MKKNLVCLATAALLTLPVGATAEETDSTDSVSGTVGVGLMVIDSGNNLNPNGSDDRLESLDESADRETTFIPIVLPRVSWDVGEPEGLKLYLTTDPPIDEVGGFAFNLGGTYRGNKAGILDMGLFFTPFEEAWENPYVTGVDREETDTSKYGFKIGLNRIMGSGFRVQFVYLNDDVDDDVIGELQPDLARDGSVYSLNMNYSHHVRKNLEIRPRLSIRKGDFDGDANSFMKYKIDLEARYMTGRWMVVPRIYYSYSDYDETHPIFGTTRENDSYGFSLLTTRMAPFNWEKWSAACLLALSKGDSNIDFYDTEAITFGGMLNYHF